MITKSYTFTNNTTIDPEEVNQNFDDMIAEISGAHHRDADGTKIEPADVHASWGLVPKGGIIMWSGTIATIPSGFALCNGENGTIDLRNKFPLCAGQDSGGDYDTGDTGGEAAHTLTENEMPSHRHTVGCSYGTDENAGYIGGTSQDKDLMFSTNTGYVGGGGAHNNMPPYLVLPFIQKV